MRNTAKLWVLIALAVFTTVGFWAGCKSAPDLSADQAKALIQAKYDHDPGTAFDISVDDRGMQEGVTAKYWAGIKRYPNGYWGDFKLTDDGKKVLKLPGGGDVIQWRPDGPSDPHFVVVVVPLALSRLKARDIGSVESIGDTRTVSFMEDVDLSGLPAALQNIAQSPANRLSTTRQATFVLNNGAWVLQSIM